MILQQILLRLATTRHLPAWGRRRLRQRPWTIQAGEASGLRIGFPQNLDFVTGLTELPMQRCIAEHLAAGDVFYDVGANVGFFSLLAARRVGASGAVYAFEPVAENAAAIRRNAALNGLTNLTVFELALDEVSRTGTLHVTRWDGGSTLTTASVAPLEPVEERAVRVVALDDLVAAEALRPPTFVKIDVEGAEMGALRGMLQTLRAARPGLVYEVDDGDRAAFLARRQAIDAFVAGLDYDVTHLPDSYANVAWQVGHSVAVPRRRPS